MPGRINKKIAKRYHNRVRDCRLRALISKQEDLAKMTGISRSVLSALENNRIFLSAPYALLIAECLGCRLDELYEKKNARFSALPT
jgi:transcriptional regulator with XRE-family HTH domain